MLLLVVTNCIILTGTCPSEVQFFDKRFSELQIDLFCSVGGAVFLIASLRISPDILCRVALGFRNLAIRYSLPLVNELGTNSDQPYEHPVWIELVCRGCGNVPLILKRWGNELRTYTGQSQLWYMNSGFLRVLKRLFCMCKMLTMLRDLTYGNGKIYHLGRSQEF